MAKKGELSDQYKALTQELLILTFSIERYCGLEIGSGDIFKGNCRRREIADAKHIFAFVAINYWEYTHLQVRNYLGIKYDSNITYGKQRVLDLIETNRAYRNRLYNISVENGIIGLIYDIMEIVDKPKS